MSDAREAVRPSFRPVRPGPVASLRQAFMDVSSRRRLIQYLVRADLKKRGSNTVLGNIWWFLDPLLTMLVYVVLVSVIMSNNTREAYPLFIFCAILPWKWFSATTVESTRSIIGREKIIKQVHFPKIVLPLATVVGGVANFIFGLVPLGLMIVIFYPSHITLWLLLIPVVAVVQFLFTLGVAIALSSITVFYRDMGLLMTHLIRMWFYLSPALYGADQVASLSKNHPELARLYNLNPFAGLFESYRSLIYYGQPPAWDLLAVVVLESLVLVVLAVLLFKRVEPAFAKVL